MRCIRPLIQCCGRRSTRCLWRIGYGENPVTFDPSNQCDLLVQSGGLAWVFIPSSGSGVDASTLWRAGVFIPKGRPPMIHPVVACRVSGEGELMPIYRMSMVVFYACLTMMESTAWATSSQTSSTVSAS